MRIACSPRGQRGIGRQFLRLLHRVQQITLERRIGDAQHHGDGLAVRFAANVGDAVFRHDDIAQRTRHGGVGIAGDDVRCRGAVLASRAAHGDDGTCAFEFMRHADEIVLAADAADHAAIRQCV